MKSQFIKILALGHGIFFLFSGIQAAQILLTFIGLALASLTLAVSWDEMKKTRKSATLFSAHIERARALYTIYVNAPEILKQQNRYQDLIHKLEFIESAEARPERPSTALTSKSVLPEPIYHFSHNAGSNGDASTILTEMASNLPTFQTSGAKLIVTDIGLSEVSPRILELYLKNEISLDFWIAKKLIQTFDVLVIPAATFQMDREMVAESIKKLQSQYNPVVVVFESKSIDYLKKSAIPASNRIIDATWV